MSLAIKVVSVFVACFATSGAVVAPFPPENIFVYNYRGDVEASTITPTPYVSRFGIAAKLFLKHDTSDPSLKNAYYAVLSSMAISTYNGKIADYQRNKYYLLELNGTDAIHDPFLIVYDTDGKLQGVKIPVNEVGWSKNMKMAIASILQLDWPSIINVEPSKSRSFISKENTIHGDCLVTYDVNAKRQIYPNDTEFIVNTFFSPTNCESPSKPVHVFDHVESEECQAEKEESLNVASQRYIEIRKKEDTILIKKVITHGSHEYVPWNARSEAHYILTNMTFTLHDVLPVNDSANMRRMNFVDIPITRDIIYHKPQGHYAIDAAVDVTQGRHVVNNQIIESELKEMLNDAANYLEEDHLYTNRSDRTRGQTINRILKTMGYMDVESFQRIFDFYKDPTNDKDVTIKNIFVEMIPQVGTTASTQFALELIRENKLDNSSAIAMLFKLPLNVREPSYELLMKMSDLKELNQEIHVEIRKAGILSFATLVGRTFKKNSFLKNTTFSLDTYLEDIYEHINNEPDYRMKIVYLMALKNVQLKETCRYLEQINQNELKVSKNPVHFRLLSIWTIDSDVCYTPNLLWPIMADRSLPIKLRIAAYEILMHRATSNADVQRIHSFMVNESNKHVYNYHYTTIQGIANSVDPCKLKLREYVRKIIRFTKIPDTVSYPLSSEYSFDYKDEKYNYAEKFRTRIILNDVTGVPEVLQFKNVITDGEKPISNFDIRVHVEGIDKIKNLINGGPSLPHDVKAKIMNMLKEFGNNRPTLKDFHLDLVLSRKGRVVFVFHYNEELWKKMWEEIFNAIFEAIMNAIMAKLSGQPIEPHNQPIRRDEKNIQVIDYDYHYEEQRVTDMGLPIIFETRIPILASVMVNIKSPGNTIIIEFDGRIWRHGEYAMSVYNPLINTWHAIRKSTATDISIPINTHIIWNKESKNASIRFPKILDRNASIGGFMIQAKTSVTVEDDDERLKVLCATCRHHEDVSFGTLERNNYQTTIDSENIGLRYTMSMFDCDNGITPMSLGAEFRRAFESEGKNDWNNWIIRAHMGMRQQIKNMMLSSQVGSCGYLLRVAPNEHAISRIELSKSATEKPSDGQKFDWTLIADIIAASSEKSAHVWDLHVSGEVINNSLQDLYIVLLRNTQGKNDFKLAMETHGEFQRSESSPYELSLQHNIVSKFAYSVNNETSRDHYYENAITLLMSPYWNDDMVELGIHSEDFGIQACMKDWDSPLYVSPNSRSRPKTLNCLKMLIRLTTMMKYKLYIDDKRLPDFMRIPSQYFEEFILSHLQPNLRFTNDTSAKDGIEISVLNDAVDISVTTSTRSYDLVNVPFKNPRITGFGHVPYPAWRFPLDNSYFGMRDLLKYTTNSIRICSLYPKILMTGDGQTVPFYMTENWTVISSDYINYNYAVIGKMIGNNMVVKVYTSNSEIELIPGDDESGQVIVDGTKLHNLPQVDKIRLYDFTMTGNIKRTWESDIIVPTENNQLLIGYGINHVVLAINADFQGKVTGLCGSLNGLDDPYIPPDDQETNEKLGEIHTM